MKRIGELLFILGIFLWVLFLFGKIPIVIPSIILVIQFYIDLEDLKGFIRKNVKKRAL